jgi:hypothetical protein
LQRDTVRMQVSRHWACVAVPDDAPPDEVAPDDVELDVEELDAPVPVVVVVHASARASREIPSARSGFMRASVS